MPGEGSMQWGKHIQPATWLSEVVRRLLAHAAAVVDCMHGPALLKVCIVSLVRR